MHRKKNRRCIDLKNESPAKNCRGFYLTPFRMKNSIQIFKRLRLELYSSRQMGIFETPQTKRPVKKIERKTKKNPQDYGVHS